MTKTEKQAFHELTMTVEHLRDYVAIKLPPEICDGLIDSVDISLRDAKELLNR